MEGSCQVSALDRSTPKRIRGVLNVGFVNRQFSKFAVLAAFGALACNPGDQRTEQVVAGMSRDSALAVLASQMGEAATVEGSAGPDSLKNIWRRTQYLVDGQNIEVLWYSQTGERWSATDTVPAGRVIPVVLVDGKVIGVGRSAYDQVAERYKLPRNRY
ncbi:MAG TPA: hypothetical protein VF981_05320 [Gemmatimonadaceae bacterium]